MKKPTHLAIKLAARIKELTDVEVKPKIHRTRAGHWQRSQGAWSWWMDTINGGAIGSDNSATECVKAKTLSFIVSNSIDIEIFVERDPE